jgi:hypothetical protein
VLFVTVDDLMLGPVVLEHALYVLGQRNKGHIRHKNANAHKALDDARKAGRGAQPAAYLRTDKRGKQDKHAEAQRDGQPHAKVNQGLVQIFAQLFLQPFFEAGGGFVLHESLAGDFGRFGQRTKPQHQRAAKGRHPSDNRYLDKRKLVRQGL